MKTSEPEEDIDPFCGTCHWWNGVKWESAPCGWINAQPVLDLAIPEKLKVREYTDGYDCPTWQKRKG
jgi:hypothetical protein